MNPPAEAKARPTWRRMIGRTENLLITVALAAQVLLPLAEAALRKWFGIGISGAATIVQHLTLVIGMLGGAIAARDQRLLSLSTAETFLSGRWRTAATVIATGVGAAIGVFLCAGSWQFVLSEREAGTILVYHLPLWLVQLILPAGFALIAWRMLWRTSTGWGGRSVALVLTLLIVAGGVWLPIDPYQCVVPALVGLALATVLGAPVFTTLGGAALILFWGDELPIASIALDHYRLVTNPTLPTIPLFTLAGYFLAEGGASKRLIRVFQALVGSVRGGSAIVTALVCAFFTSFTGASGVTILALGGLLMPVLVAARYSERNALGLLTGAGSLLGCCCPPVCR